MNFLSFLDKGIFFVILLGETSIHRESSVRKCMRTGLKGFSQNRLSGSIGQWIGDSLLFWVGWLRQRRTQCLEFLSFRVIEV